MPVSTISRMSWTPTSARRASASVQQQRAEAGAPLDRQDRERLDLADPLAGRPGVVGAVVVDVRHDVADRPAGAAREHHERVPAVEEAVVERAPPGPGLLGRDHRDAGGVHLGVLVEEREPQRLELVDQLETTEGQLDAELSGCPVRLCP